MRKDIDMKRNWIKEQLEFGKSQIWIARELGCKIDTLTTRLKKWDLVHLNNRGGKGSEKKWGRIHVSKYLGLNLKPITSHKLKLKLWRDGYKEKKCEVCGIEEWNGLPAPLELDHIDGNHWDNTFENLRILCPNCHAQTPTNSGKNKGKSL